MKKLSVSKILLVSLFILLLNSCSKSNNMPTSGSVQDSTSTTHSGPGFELAYVITPLVSDIKSITFSDEDGILQTVYNTDLFPGGIREMKVWANPYKARIWVEVANPNNHPFGFRLEIRVNGQTKQTQNFTFPTQTSYAVAFAEYDVQFD